ncbi:MAG: hypothetical protein AB7K24_28095 [Gemmataceae bacterium]
MALTDFWQVINTNVNNGKGWLSLTNWSGSVNLSAGSALTGVIGGRQTHIMGSELKIVCDPLSFLPPTAGWASMGLALICGMMGEKKVVFGHTGGLIYGKKYEVLRGGKESELKAVKVEGWNKGVPMAPKTDDVDDMVIDGAAVAACFALSLAVVAAGTTLDILARVKTYDEKGKPTEATNFYTGISSLVCSRLVGIMEVIEYTSGWITAAARIGKALKWTGIALACVTVLPITCYGIYKGVKWYQARSQREVQQLAEDIENSIPE